jgi:hypothetical protein
MLFSVSTESSSGWLAMIARSFSWPAMSTLSRSWIGGQRGFGNAMLEWSAEYVTFIVMFALLYNGSIGAPSLTEPAHEATRPNNGEE